MSRLLSSLLVVLAGLILLADKFCLFLNIKFKNNYGFPDTEQFVWYFSQIIVLVLVIIAVQFKPYKISYYIPIYISFLQLYWLLFSPTFSDSSFFNWYVFGSSILFVISIFFISSFFKKDEEDKERLSVLENILDLTYLQIQRNKKSNEV